MRRLIASEFITLDGVMEAPGFEQHRAGRNAWALQLQDPESQAANEELANSAGALLFGRVTYQIFAAFWPTAPASEFTQRMNDVPKFVVSTTLEQAHWPNTTVIRGDAVRAVTALKEQDGGDLVLYGSADLLADLLAADLVDELRVMLFPVILGSGKHLFRDEIDLRHLALVRSRTFDNGVVLLVYAPREAPAASPYLDAFVWTPDQVRSFEAAQDSDRFLATVLFTDIVDSTARAAELGDRAWRRLLDRHDTLAAGEVGRWHGQLVKTTGDGILATFDTPTRAIRCAFGLREAVHGLGLEIRAAIHTGEIDRRGTDIGGLCVHIAARALLEAGTGDVVVTRTVRDVTSAPDLAFSPLGSVALRGVPGQWELFSASPG